MRQLNLRFFRLIWLQGRDSQGGTDVDEIGVEDVDRQLCESFLFMNNFQNLLRERIGPTPAAYIAHDRNSDLTFWGQQ
jgi:hypothetical protein